MPWSRFLFVETYPPGRHNNPSPPTPKSLRSLDGRTQPLPHNEWYPLDTIQSLLSISTNPPGGIIHHNQPVRDGQ
jgi:hypothetical protein